jgi:hypothetical protein
MFAQMRVIVGGVGVGAGASTGRRRGLDVGVPVRLLAAEAA